MTIFTGISWFHVHTLNTADLEFSYLIRCWLCVSERSVNTQKKRTSVLWIHCAAWATKHHVDYDANAKCSPFLECSLHLHRPTPAWTHRRQIRLNEDMINSLGSGRNVVTGANWPQGQKVDSLQMDHSVTFTWGPSTVTFEKQNCQYWCGCCDKFHSFPQFHLWLNSFKCLNLPFLPIKNV